MPTTNTTRLIENWLPINEISVEAIREGDALAGHPPVNQLHVWWARRPLVVSRATVAAALLRADADQAQFIRGPRHYRHRRGRAAPDGRNQGQRPVV